MMKSYLLEVWSPVEYDETRQILIESRDKR
jgi:hypothetical protein